MNDKQGESLLRPSTNTEDVRPGNVGKYIILERVVACFYERHCDSLVLGNAGGKGGTCCAYSKKY